MKKLLDIPDDLFRIMESQAKQNRRSTTQEIIHILYSSQSKEQQESRKMTRNQSE